MIPGATPVGRGAVQSPQSLPESSHHAGQPRRRVAGGEFLEIGSLMPDYDHHVDGVPIGGTLVSKADRHGRQLYADPAMKDRLIVHVGGASESVTFVTDLKKLAQQKKEINRQLRDVQMVPGEGPSAEGQAILYGAQVVTQEALPEYTVLPQLEKAMAKPRRQRPVHDEELEDEEPAPRREVRKVVKRRVEVAEDDEDEGDEELPDEMGAEVQEVLQEVARRRPAAPRLARTTVEEPPVGAPEFMVMITTLSDGDPVGTEGRWFHGVQSCGRGLVLFYDTRYKQGAQWFPVEPSPERRRLVTYRLTLENQFENRDLMYCGQRSHLGPVEFFILVPVPEHLLQPPPETDATAVPAAELVPDAEIG